MDFDLEQSIAVLERTPGVLHALLVGLPTDWTSSNEGPDTWSACDEERLARFASLRKANLAELRAMRLSPAQLTLTGEHPAFGSVTLSQLLATWVVHDLGHLAQIGRVMAKQYREAVGPWEAYLPVLHRP